MDDGIKERLDALEQRLSALEGDGKQSDPSPDDGTFWALDGLKKQFPAPGAVLYTGAVEIAAGPVEWQIAYPTERLMDEDWSSFAATLSALGHPVRLRILHAVVGGVETVAQLAEMDEMGTTGQLYHHINQLSAQGWLIAMGRGKYAVPPERVVPLLAILAAAHR